MNNEQRRADNYLEGLKENQQQIRDVTIPGFFGCRTDWNDANLRKLFQILKSKKKINEIGFDHIDIGNDLLRELLSSIENIEVQSLRLAYSDFDNLGMDYLVDYLAKNNNLKELYIYGNEFGNQGFRKLVDAIKFNKSIEWLDVENVGINDHSILTFKNLFAHNFTIQHCVYEFGNDLSNSNLELIRYYTRRNRLYPSIKAQFLTWLYCLSHSENILLPSELKMLIFEKTIMAFATALYS